MSSVSSVHRSYDQRMRNVYAVYAVRSHTLNNFEPVHNIIGPLRITKRTPSYVSVF